ncbi:MAG: hypothetical protein Q4B43_05470 [Bacteroidota bacterium]|nr:hypothetical protein [Bacteroidota bacterium]
MVDDITDVLKEAREAIQSMWTGRCRVIKFGKVKGKNNIVNPKEIVVYDNVPCRLSHKNISQVQQEEPFATTSQVIKVFIAPDLDIPAGCKIEITQNGVTKTYENSGVSAVYTNHQEIILQIVKDKA